MAGGEVGCAEPVGEREHRVEPHVAVAAHARVRGQARRVVGEERRDDARGERGAQVEREVRQPQLVRDRAREPDGVRGAARRLGVVGRIAPQLERDRDRLAPGSPDEQRGDRRVDAAAHRDERARRVERRLAGGRHRGAERDISASAASSAACSLPGESPPSSADTAAAPIRAASRTLAPRSSPTAAEPEPRPRRSPTPRSRHPRPGRRRSPGRSARDRRTARPGAAREGRRGHVTAPPREPEMLRECLGVHAAECRPRRAADDRT